MRFFAEMKPTPEELIRDLRGDLRKAGRAGMLNVVTTVESKAVVNAPAKTGNLARGGTSEANQDGTRGTVTFTAKGKDGTEYAELVHEGTGLFGPRRQRIVPTKKKALFWPGAPHPVKSVAGMKARPFLRKAAEDSDIAALYAEGAENYLKSGGK